MSTGLWNQPGVPHKGWSCVGTVDLREDDPAADLAICEMCRVQEIRYVHQMQHPDYVSDLNVGCVCAEKMEGDYEAPRHREGPLRSAAGRRDRWMRGRWRQVASGGQTIESLGYRVIVEPTIRDGRAGWGGSITPLRTRRKMEAKRVHDTAEAAKLAAYKTIQIWHRARSRPASRNRSDD